MTELKTKGKATQNDVLIGRLLKKTRKSLGITQVELAGRVDITFQQLQKYESGTNRITISRLLDIAKALGFKATDFIRSIENEVFGRGSSQPLSAYGFGEQQQSTYGSKPAVDNETRQLLQYYHTIQNKEDRQVILDMAKRLSESHTN